MRGYWSIKHQAGTKETGKEYPQLKCLDFDSAYGLHFDELPSHDIKLKFALAPKAKLTDVVSDAAISAYGLMINKKVLDIIQRHRIMKHQIVQCQLKMQDGAILEYYWLHLADFNLIYEIDYPKSTFFIRKGIKRIADPKFNDYNEFAEANNKKESVEVIRAEKLKLKESFVGALDMFVIPMFDGIIYISDELRQEMENSRVTGIEYKEAEKIIISG